MLKQVTCDHFQTIDEDLSWNWLFSGMLVQF